MDREGPDASTRFYSRDSFVICDNDHNDDDDLLSRYPDDVVEEQRPGVALGRARRPLRSPQEAQDDEEEVLRATRRGARLPRLPRVLRQQEEIREQAAAEAQHTPAQLLQHQ